MRFDYICKHAIYDIWIEGCIERSTQDMETNKTARISV